MRVHLKDQMWFFLYESSHSPYFHLSNEALSVEQIRDLRLLEILRLSKIKGDVGDFAFFIHSPSMNQPILLNDDNILNTWKKRCKEDTAVTIHMRLDCDEHPQDKLAASFHESLTARRQILGEGLAEYTMRDGPAPPKPEPRVMYQERGPRRNFRTSYTLVWSLNETWDTPKTLEQRRVYIDLGGGRNRPFLVRGLVPLIRDQVLKGRCATDVEIPYCSRNSDGITSPHKLSAKIWEESLLRGPWRTIFENLWDNHRCGRCATCDGQGLEPAHILVQEMAKTHLDSGSPPGTCTADSGYMSEEIQEGAEIKV